MIMEMWTIMKGALHSNMVLLILNFQNSRKVKTESLHSNMVLLILFTINYQFLYQFTLHSNMVLLIRLFVWSSSNLLNSFTFQYGSINTGVRWCRGVRWCNFTFQYGSINTWCCCSLCSAMHLYIPIWFY